jgi:hypothetical protein
MKKFSRILLAGLLLLSNIAAFSQSESVEMADQFRADGKIYVVVAIILVVLLGFVAYLFLLDRKLTNIDKALNAKSTKVK